MAPGTGGEAADARYRMRLISGAMIGSVVAFTAVALFMRSLMTTSVLDLFAYVALAAALGSLPVAHTLRQRMWPGEELRQTPGYWTRRQQAQILPLAVLEAPALTCGMALMLSKLWWPLLGIFLALATMLAWFPRDES